MTDDDNIEWLNKHEFAQYAEVLGCNTVDIFGVNPTKVGAFVIYSPGASEWDADSGDELIAWAAHIRRDADGIWRVWGEPTPMPGFFEKLALLLDAHTPK